MRMKVEQAKKELAKYTPYVNEVIQMRSEMEFVLDGVTAEIKYVEALLAQLPASYKVEENNKVPIGWDAKNKRITWGNTPLADCPAHTRVEAVPYLAALAEQVIDKARGLLKRMKEREHDPGKCGAHGDGGNDHRKPGGSGGRS
jgi:hypothetical protein